MKWEPQEPNLLTMWIFSIKNGEFSQKDQFLTVHYHNYISYIKYKIYQKEETIGTCLYSLLNS